MFVRGIRVLGSAGAVLVVALAVAPATASGGSSSSLAADEPATDQIVIRMAAGKSFDPTALGATAGVGLKHVRRLTDGSYVLKLPSRRSVGLVRAITDRLAARGDVVLAEPDAMMQPLAIPNDTRWPEQWDLFAPAGGSYGAALPGAWDITTGSAGITVGVIDTGYRPHADLAGRFVAGYDFIADTQIANDGNGRDADALDPGDWITSAENSNGYFAGCGTRNSSWHGTHLSGTIGAASNNGLGVAGINWVSKIQPLRVLGKCGGYTSDIADAIRWGAGLSVSGLPANTTPSDVLNLSLGGSGVCSSTYQNAINAAVAAGTVVVVAAGNDNADAASYQPASCANVITVAATGHTGSRAYYSNYGTTVEIAAPGGDAQLGKTILSTLNAGPTTPAGDSYENYQGTSMATPHVIGVVSLMLSVNPSLTPAQVTSMLKASVTPFPAGSTCSTSSCGAGIVNAAAAVVIAAATVPVNTALPLLSGTAQVGQTLTGTDGTWSGTAPITFTRQWRLCDAAGGSCADTGSATGSSYAPIAGDVGKTLRLRVNASNVAGGPVSADSAPSAVVIAAASGGGGGGGGGGSGAADLYLTGAAEPVSVPVGGTITWRVRVLDDKNYRPATGVYVDLVLPAGVQVVSATTDRGQGCVSSGAGKLRCNLDWLSSDAPYANIVVVTNVTAAGELVLGATVGYSQADSDPSNNTLTLRANTPALVVLVPPTPKPPVVVKPVFGTPLTLPKPATASKKFVFTLVIRRSDTGRLLTTGTMVADPTVAGKLIKHVESFKAGKARVAFVLPKKAKGRLLKIKIKITVSGQTTTRLYTTRVR